MADSCLRMPGYVVEERLITSRIGVVPVGSIEYHGPHLPLGTDSLIAAEVSKRVAAELSAVLFPLVAYTSEYRRREFKGTVSVDGRVLIEYMAEILRGVLRSGLGGVLMLSAHGPNEVYCPEAGRIVADEFPDKIVMFIQWWKPVLTPGVSDELGLSPLEVAGEHGGEVEGSVLASIAPESVHLGMADEILYERPYGPLEFFGRTGMRTSPEYAGYGGRVGAIDATKGEILIGKSVNSIVPLVRRLLGDIPHT